MKLKLFCPTVFVLIFVFFFSCDKQRDKNNSQEYTDQLTILLNDFKDNFSNKAKTLEINKDILAISEKYHDTFQMIVSQSYLANTHFFIGNFDEAILDYRKLLRIFNLKPKLTDYEIQSLRDSHLNMSRVFLSLGESYLSTGKIGKSLNCFEKSSQIAAEQDDKYYMLMSKAYMSKLNEQIGKYELATKNGVKILREFDKLNEEKHQFIVDLAKLRLATIISTAYLERNKVDSALVILEKVKDKHYNKLDLQSKIENSYGEVYLKQKEYNKALSKFNEARYLFTDFDSIFGRKAYAYNIARAHFYLNDYDRAITELKNSLTSTKKNDIFQKIKTYRLLAKTYKNIGNLNSSTKYYDMYVNLETEIEQAKSLISNEFHNQEISNLKIINRKNILIILKIFSGLIVVILIFIGIRNKKNRQKFESLIGKIESLEKESLNSKNLNRPTKKHAIKDSEVDRIIVSLEGFVDKEQYLSMQCTLASTAKKLSTNTTYLSKVINIEYQKSFNTFLNELRINYALQRLKSDKMFRRYSIQSIANELGYKSKESFNKTFRNQTGILPSYFIKKIEKEFK